MCNLTKPIPCCSMPLPQLVVLSVMPIMWEGRRRSGQCRRTWKLRVSMSCASSGLIDKALTSPPPVRMAGMWAFPGQNTGPSRIL